MTDLGQIYDRYMTDLWHIYGRYMTDLWQIYGRYMTDLWHIYGRYMDTEILRPNRFLYFRLTSLIENSIYILCHDL